MPVRPSLRYIARSISSALLTWPRPSPRDPARDFDIRVGEVARGTRIRSVARHPQHQATRTPRSAAPAFRRAIPALRATWPFNVMATTPPSCRAQYVAGECTHSNLRRQPRWCLAQRRSPRLARVLSPCVRGGSIASPCSTVGARRRGWPRASTLRAPCGRILVHPHPGACGRRGLDHGARQVTQCPLIDTRTDSKSSAECKMTQGISRRHASFSGRFFQDPDTTRCAGIGVWRARAGDCVIYCWIACVRA